MEVRSKLEVITNLAILIVAVLLAIILLKEHILPKPRPTRHAGISVGSLVQLPGVSWNVKDKTLVLGLNTQCRYCAESSSFYRTLTEALANNKGAQIIAVFPQPTSESTDCLKKRHIEVSSLVQRDLSSLQMPGTPTLLLVDRAGRVVKKWFGKLNSDQEATVWSALGCKGPQNCS